MLSWAGLWSERSECFGELAGFAAGVWLEGAQQITLSLSDGRRNVPGVSLPGISTALLTTETKVAGGLAEWAVGNAIWIFQNLISTLKFDSSCSAYSALVVLTDWWNSGQWVGGVVIRIDSEIFPNFLFPVKAKSAGVFWLIYGSICHKETLNVLGFLPWWTVKPCIRIKKPTASHQIYVRSVLR